MNTRVHRVFSGLNQATSIKSSGANLYNLTTGAINLTDRQIGFFNAETLVSLDVTGANRLISSGVPVIIAMGYDSNGDGTVDSVIKSLPIDSTRITKISKQGYKCPLPQIKRFTWTSTDCDTEYCLKFNFNSVAIAEALGFNPLYKTFSVTTDCCDDACETCGGGDCDLLADSMVDTINDDSDAFVTATKQALNNLSLANVDISSYVAGDYAVVTAGGQSFYFEQGDYTADAAGDAAELQTELQAFIDSYNLGGTVGVTRNGSGDYTIAITSAYISSINFDPDGEDDTTTATAVVGGCPTVFTVANFAAIADFCQLPINLTEPNGLTFDIYGDCAFDCNLTVTDVQDLQYEQGEGVGVKDMEEEASGYGVDHWYRYTKLIQPDPVRNLLTDVTKNYAIYVIEHQDLHEGAPSGHFFRSTLQTILAVPTGTVNCSTGSVTESTLETGLDTYLGT